MAFGNRSRRIEKLEAIEAACELHRPYIPFAEEIGRQVTAQAARYEANVEEVINDAMANVAESAKQKLLLEAFKNLPPEQRFAALTKHFPDALTREVLAAEQEKLVIRDEAQRKIHGMQRECRETRSVDLQDVPADSRIRIALHDVRDFTNHQSPKSMQEKTKPDRVLTAISLGNSGFQVLHDVITNHTEASFLRYSQFEPYETAELGGDIKGGGERAHIVYYGSALTAKTPEGLENFTLVPDEKSNLSPLSLGIAHIAINDQEVMGPSFLPAYVPV